MPPRRGRTAASASKSKAPTPARPSRLAKEHGLSAAQEAEIREAFALFAVQHPDYADDKEGVLRREDVRRCLIALNIPPSPTHPLPSILSTIDPLKTGLVQFMPFLAYVALALNSASDSDNSSSPSAHASDAEDDELSATDAAAIQSAFSLFTHGQPGPITLGHLRRVAKELKEDVDDGVLRDMIREANGDAKGKGREKDVGTVGIEEFESVLRRAGVSFG